MDSAPAAAASSSPARKKQKIDGGDDVEMESTSTTTSNVDRDYKEEPKFLEEEEERLLLLRLDEDMELFTEIEQQQKQQQQQQQNLNSASFHALLEWAENNFEPEHSGAILTSSPDLTAREVLNFIMKYVYLNHPIDGNEYVDDEEDQNRMKSSRAALNFVSCWLAKERDEPKPFSDASQGIRAPTIPVYRIPSLSQLCAQRLAVDIFSGLTDAVQENVIDHIQDNKGGHRFWDERLKVFHACILSKIDNQTSLKDVPEIFQNDVDDVIEELYIFTIVYILYADLRTIQREPRSRSDVKFPVFNQEIRENIDGDGEDWWTYCGQILAYGIVPNLGRGSLAKAGLLPHAILTHYLNNYSSDPWDAGYAGYDAHTRIMRDLIQNRHFLQAFACSVAIPSIAAFVHVYHDSSEEHEMHEFLLQTYKHLNGGLSPPTDEYDKLLCVSKEAPMELFRDVQKNPLKIMRLDTLNTLVGDYLDTCEAAEIFNEHYVYSDSKTYVQRLRLRGDHDKAYLLKAAITSMGAQFLDLQHCSSLDEECLVAMLYHMRHVKRVLLHGTSIPEDSNVIQEMTKKRKIHFVFKSGVCQCCGRVPFLNNDHVDSSPSELIEENRKLKEEIAKLRSRLAQLP